MSRARILADYVSSGDELADKAPLASPTFTGIVQIPNISNLETDVAANTAKTGITSGQASAITANTAKTGITSGQASAITANTAKVTNYNQTLADINALDVTELGTVTSGNLSNTAIVYPAGHTLQTVASNTAFNGGATLSVTGGTATDSDGNGFTISNVTAGNLITALVTGGLSRTKSTSAVSYANFGLVFSPNSGADTSVMCVRIYSRYAVVDNVYTDYAGMPICATYTVPSGVTSVTVKRTVVSDTGVLGWWHSASTTMTPCIITETQA